MKKWNVGAWLCLCAALCCCILAVVFFLVDTRTTEQSEYLIGMHKTGVGALQSEPVVQQRFVVEKNDLAAVDAMVSTYAKKLKSGTLTLWLEDDQGRELARRVFDVKELKNNSFVTLPLDRPDSASAGKTYVLCASADCTEQKGVTLRMGPADGVSGLRLTLADGSTDEENALYLRTEYRTTAPGKLSGMLFALLALCFAAALPLPTTRMKKEADHE